MEVCVLISYEAGEYERAYYFQTRESIVVARQGQNRTLHVMVFSN